MPQNFKITKIYLKHQIEIVDCGIGRFELKMTKTKQIYVLLNNMVRKKYTTQFIFKINGVNKV